LPQIALSIGVSAFPLDASNQDDLARFARLALYMAKGSGSNRVVAADPRNPRWVSDARSAFVRSVTEAQMPVSLQERR
jgi:predicted signal transduction protein with EAL and GGDEF domain